MNSLAIIRTSLLALIVFAMIVPGRTAVVVPLSSVPVASPSTSNPAFHFRDNFNYKSLSDFVAAGWRLCGTSLTSYYQVQNGKVILLNDGYNAATVCWSHIPSNVTDWTVTVNGAWVGNTVGTILVAVRTSSHYYIWLADGYYGIYTLQRYNTNQYVSGDYSTVISASGYTPMIGVSHILTLSVRSGLVSASFDRVVIGSYAEADPTTLTEIVPSSAWMTNNAFTYVTATG